tara:strand:- start:823 stop:1110 length:288 start_codon:yes stop_codon:yes gene_type:complete
MKKRSLSLIMIILFFGTMLGSIFGELIGWILPESVVKEFFLKSINFSLGGLIGDDNGVINLNLIMISLQFGMKLTFNFCSIIGFSAAYYFLRYFR